jgi:HK97 family phage prohead protease
MERRALQFEVRTARDNPRRLEGHAAVFDTETRVADFVETIRSGAFAATLASGADVLALVDHDPTRVLGRTRSGTLRLLEDARGLAFSLDLPDTQTARDVLALTERGDIGGMSFGFRATGEHWSGNRRELRAVELREISVVSAWPAYSNTSVEARSRRTPTFPAALRWR